MKYYSLTCGNYVDSLREVIEQIISNLIYYHTFDLRWRKVK